MKADTVIALDVGGTSIKSAVLKKGALLVDTIQVHPAKSNQPKDVILDHFADIVATQFTQNYGMPAHVANSEALTGIGFAFPGPFDYAEGISYIRGLNKFDTLYGAKVGNELLERLYQRSSIESQNREVDIRFENDARVFALGVSERFPNEKLICLTIGTGLGSAFIDNCMIVQACQGVPNGGWLYKQPFRNGIVDDYFSRRGILRLASTYGFRNRALDVKDLADIAREGNEQARAVFARFGGELAKMLLPYVSTFQPDRIVIGGQIAKSYDLFAPDLRRTLALNASPVQAFEHSLHYTFQGIAKLFS